MDGLRSLLFALLFYPGTLLFCLAVILVTPFGEKPVQAIVHGWAKFHFWLVQHVLRIKIRWEGDIPSGPYLIAVKHQSMMEAVDTLRFGDQPVVVMKRELADMPLWGKVARTYGIIGVDREAGASALRAMMAEAKAATATGRPVIMASLATQNSRSNGSLLPPNAPPSGGWMTRIRCGGSCSTLASSRCR